MTEPTARDYSKTLFLPETDFPMRAGLPEREPEFLARWEKIGLYDRLRAQGAGKPRFVLHDGPPYANGHLHIGHALNKILKDIVTRSRQMMGFDSNYVPGWDCHGLPIEWKIEEEYRAKGKNKDDVEVVEFRRQCRAFAEHWVGVQREEFKRLGGTGDWANPYLTMSFDAEAQIAREIMKFAENGTLYRGSKPVMWSVVEKTALAEAEVEYHDHTSDAITVAFPVRSCTRIAQSLQTEGMKFLSFPEAILDARIVIWTTTPWTIPGNRAIAFNSRLATGYGLYQVTEAPENNWAKVGDKLILGRALAEQVLTSAKVKGEFLGDIPEQVLAATICDHPLRSLGYDFPVPLLDGDHVTDDAGTGFVHTAPGHGADDYIIWTKYQRELRTRDIDTTIPYTVGADGSLTDEAPGFTGRFVLTHKGEKGDANDAVIKALAEAGNILARSRLKHSYPHSWRSKKPVIFRNTPQWFISMDKDIAGADGTAKAGDTLRTRALNAIKATQWVPAYGENRINGMIESRPDWVVSRQRAWGVPITVFVNVKTGEILRDPAVNARIAAAFEAEGADAWFKDDAAQRFLGDAYNAADFEKIDDVLDVWFDSGSTHSYTLETRDALKVNRKVDGGTDFVMYLEGSDQHRGWFHSSLLESCGTRGRAPFDVVLTHGFVMDQNGEKMSKSLGNVVTPQEVIKQSGADILRLWVSSSDYSDDLRLGKAILQTNIDTYRKVRNTLRWMLGSLAHFKAEERVALKDMPELERYILAELSKLDEVVAKGYAEYDYKRICASVVQFMNVDLSAFYFDIRKDTLYCDPASSTARKAALTVVDILFDTLTRWLAPLLVFTTDEAWVARHGEASSVHLELFPTLDAAWRNDALVQKWEAIRDIRRVVTGALEIERAQKRIGSSLEAAPVVYVSDAARRALFDGLDLAEICITSGATLGEGDGPAEAFRIPDVAGVAIVPQRAGGVKCARSWKYFDPATADPAYPGITPRDAQAMRELDAAGKVA